MLTFSLNAHADVDPDRVITQVDGKYFLAATGLEQYTICRNGPAPKTFKIACPNKNFAEDSHANMKKRADAICQGFKKRAGADGFAWKTSERTKTLLILDESGQISTQSNKGYFDGIWDHLVPYFTEILCTEN